MKKILFFLLLVVITNSIYSQDLIVTNDGDSINCKITRVKTGNVYFTFNHKNEIRNTLLPLSNIKNYKFDFYDTSEIPEGKIIGYENYQHIRIAVNGGYSYMTAKVAESVPTDFRKYVKGLKSGYHFGGDINYYFTETLGFGGKYFVFKSSNSIDDIYLEYDNGDIEYGKMSDDLTISFIGPIFSTRILSPSKQNAFLMNISLGYMGYSNDKIVIDKYKMTGSTMGLSLDVGYDIGLSKNLSLGFQLSLISGVMSSYKLSDGTYTETITLEKGNYEGLNRVDLSIGLRFNK